MVHELLLAFLIELILETLGRQQVPGLGGILWMVQHPVVFFYNVLIVFATLCIGSRFRRRVFVTGLISFVWLIIGAANGMILNQRMTPFTMKDLSAATEGATILTNYMPIWQIVLIGVVILLVVAGFVVLFIKGPKHKERIKLKRNLIVCLLIIGSAFGSTYALQQNIAPFIMLRFCFRHVPKLHFSCNQAVIVCKSSESFRYFIYSGISNIQYVIS
jgi:hypothetical protein